MSRTLKISFVLLMGMMFATLFILMQKPWVAGAATPVGAENTATSTGTQATFPNFRNAMRNDFRPGYGTSTPGVLDGITITAPGLTEVWVYDATSTATNVDTNYGPVGTTTLMHFAVSAGVGDYPCGCVVRKGVLIEYKTNETVGSWASSTIRFRRE